MRRAVIGALLASCLAFAGCAAQRPVLYPNPHYRSVGGATAQSDVDACMRSAEAHGAGDGLDEQAIEDTAKGAAVGAATGGVAGAVAGNAGRGAAIGAAGGATAGLARAIVDADEPDPVFKRFVERCLFDLGYDVVGWN